MIAEENRGLHSVEKAKQGGTSRGVLDQNQFV